MRYPYAMGDSAPVANLERCGFSADVLDGIKAANARRFLGI